MPGPSEWVVVLFFFGLWFVFAFVCASIWSNKGGSYGAGFVIGLFLGVIGLVIVAVAQPSGARAATQSAAGGVGPAHPQQYGTSIASRTCPFCKSEIPPDATVCRFCQRESEPWHFMEGKAWVAVDDAGREHWLNERTREWLPVRRIDTCPYCHADMPSDESLCASCNRRSSRKFAGEPYTRVIPPAGPAAAEPPAVPPPS
jgi:RNA polymerase subunit RPABC4/transcription elongation factor Spt4